MTVAYPTNFASHPALEGKTPYFMLYGHDPGPSKLRTFGGRVLVHGEAYRPKLEPTAWGGKLVGYNYGSVAYRLYNLKTHRVVESRNVSFIEPRVPR